MSEDETPSGPLFFTWDWDDLTAAEWNYHTARAYLDSSILIFSAILDQTFPGTYHHCRVGAFSCDHALELFLKATILQAGRQPTNTHELEQLYNEFRNLYPGKRFEFRARITELVRSNPDRPASVYPRYPTDKAGKKWEGDSYLIARLRLEQANTLREDFDRIWPLVQERYPIR